MAIPQPGGIAFFVGNKKMGTGDQARRAALGKMIGETEGLLEREAAMIPIREEQVKADLAFKEEAFAQELEQREALYLLAQRLQDESERVTQPMYVTGAERKPTNYLLYIGLAILAYIFLVKKK